MHSNSLFSPSTSACTQNFQEAAELNQLKLPSKISQTSMQCFMQRMKLVAVGARVICVAIQIYAQMEVTLQSTLFPFLVSDQSFCIPPTIPLYYTSIHAFRPLSYKGCVSALARKFFLSQQSPILRRSPAQVSLIRGTRSRNSLRKSSYIRKYKESTYLLSFDSDVKI